MSWFADTLGASVPMLLIGDFDWQVQVPVGFSDQGFSVVWLWSNVRDRVWPSLLAA